MYYFCNSSVWLLLIERKNDDLPVGISTANRPVCNQCRGKSAEFSSRRLPWFWDNRSWFRISQDVWRYFKVLRPLSGLSRRYRMNSLLVRPLSLSHRRSRNVSRNRTYRFTSTYRDRFLSMVLSAPVDSKEGAGRIIRRVGQVPTRQMGEVKFVIRRV